MEPYSKKLGTDTWFHAKRCFLSLIENLAKQMIVVRDSVLYECLAFLEQCEGRIEKKLTSTNFIIIKSSTVQHLAETSKHTLTVRWKIKHLMLARIL